MVHFCGRAVGYLASQLVSLAGQSVSRFEWSVSGARLSVSRVGWSASGTKQLISETRQSVSETAMSPSGAGSRPLHQRSISWAGQLKYCCYITSFTSFKLISVAEQLVIWPASRSLWPDSRSQGPDGRFMGPDWVGWSVSGARQSISCLLYTSDAADE